MKFLATLFCLVLAFIGLGLIGGGAWLLRLGGKVLDRDFIARHTSGFDQFAVAVRAQAWHGRPPRRTPWGRWSRCS